MKYNQPLQNQKLINVKKQVRRLQKELSITHSTAKEVLAKAIYHCEHGWQELQRHIELGKKGNHRYVLMSITPDEPGKHIDTLNAHIQAIANDINRQIRTRHDQLSLTNLIWRVFGFKNVKPDIHLVYPNMPILNWHPLNIGPDINAVLHTYVCINGVLFQLLATRVNQPEYLSWQSKEESECAKYLFDGPYEGASTPEIVWDKPKKWATNVKHYVQSYMSLDEDDDWNEVFDTPSVSLSKAMSMHSKWFIKSYDLFINAEEYRPLPITLLGHTYSVFGFPVKGLNSTHKDSPSFNVNFNDEFGSDSTVVLIDNMPITIETFEVDKNGSLVDEEYTEYFDTVNDSLFFHPNYCTQTLIEPSGRKILGLIRPTFSDELDRHRQIKFTPEKSEILLDLEAKNISSAISVLDKIYNKEIKISKSNNNQYGYACINIKDKTVAPNICCSIFDFPSSHYISGLPKTIGIANTEEGYKCYLSISKQMIRLCEIFHKRKLSSAIKNGLRLTITEEQYDMLDDTPNCFTKLSFLSEDEELLYNPDWDF